MLQQIPSDYYTSSAVAWFFTAWAGALAVLIFPWTIYRLVKKKDSVPILVWFGGIICSLIEPMLDELGHVWWALNLPVHVFRGFDMTIPILVVLAYIFFVAFSGYWAYCKIRKGLTVKGVFYVWLALIATDVVLEYPGLILGAYTYYGDQPFRLFNFPLWWTWVNATGWLLIGLLLWLVVPHLRGWANLIILLVPVTGFGTGYGVVAWPNFMALNWEMPVIVAWMLSTFSLGIALLVVRGIAAMVATDSPLRLKDWSAVTF